MLRCCDVTFSYADKCVVENVDLSVEAGELFCIVGANGAGKSTLLRLCAGLMRPNRGTVRCFEFDPAARKRKPLARRLAFVPQRFWPAFPFLVRDIVVMGRYAHRRFAAPLNTADQDAVEQALAQADILAIADRRFDEISGGEQRRALLAQALCQQAQLILLDEPTASLDPNHAVALFRTLQKERQRGTAILVVTHDLNLAVRFADRMGVMANGRILAAQAPVDVLRSNVLSVAFSHPMRVERTSESATSVVVPA